MKIIKISFFISLFLLSIMGCKANPVLNCAINNGFDVKQSPLCDDETNPLEVNSTEVAEFDTEENDENNSCFSDFNIFSFSKLNNSHLHLICLGFNDSYKYHLNFSFSDSVQSYLQVFRI